MHGVMFGDLDERCDVFDIAQKGFCWQKTNRERIVCGFVVLIVLVVVGVGIVNRL